MRQLFYMKMDIVFILEITNIFQQIVDISVWYINSILLIYLFKDNIDFMKSCFLFNFIIIHMIVIDKRDKIHTNVNNSILLWIIERRDQRNKYVK